MNNDWEVLLQDEFQKEYYKKVRQFLKIDGSKYKIFPEEADIFKALKLTNFENVKCVILGQDPYHGYNQAHGLAFSVKNNRIPPSLQNIFKELKSDLGFNIPKSGDLTKWAEEGVLLLNTILTVRENEANSHANIGWEIFTDKIISLLNVSTKPICFILWGNYAKKKQSLITNNIHLVLTGSHPSPLSSYNGFFGGKYFSKTNDFLKACGQSPIIWDLN